ncbi:hypothetical protein Q5Y75_05635 [Ruegeria sp. 2205SS24-7]|uniref:hypothetical protein n=1 Tax=Ruegeria discodermiae TaxID=3064389 RepID=UPI002741F6AC|nr:hypothetical protein [Ruegeria sp. 2205SS24-7]MDP5216692.1 hypothetical protein [Ruegeria sp. 2205SS24-7]
MARSDFEAVPRALDSNGDPVSGARMYVYEGGSTTDKTVYSDIALTTPHTQPIVADAAGFFAQVYAAAGVYKFVVKDASDVTIYEADNIHQENNTITFASDAELQLYLTNYGANYENGTVLESPTSKFEKTSSGWVDRYTADDAVAIAGAKIDDAVNQVAVDRLVQMTARTVVGNPTDSLATPINMGNAQLQEMMGFAGASGGNQHSLNLPSAYTDSTVTQIRLGFVTTTTSGTTAVVFDTPFSTEIHGVLTSGNGPVDTNVREIITENRTITGFDVAVNRKDNTGTTRVARTVFYVAFGN